MKITSNVILILFLLSSSVRSQVVRYANPMCGTGDFNNTFPGADAPFGMIQWSPETGTHKGGYSYSDSQIWDFSLDHLSGAGCQYGENFAFMPILGTAPTSSPGRSTFATTFSHSNEIARPGYYSVTLGNGIKAELTTTTRCGYGRFTYPSGYTETMMLNAAGAVNGTLYSSVVIDTTDRTVSGSATSKVFCGGSVSTTYFYAVFSQPFKSFSCWSGSVVTEGDTAGSGASSGAFITFDTTVTRTILVRVSISYVSIANAKMNLEKELPDSVFSSGGFYHTVAADSVNWNSWLSRIEVTGGSTDQLNTFYSMLYHALLFPSTCSDVNGDYMGYDGKIHSTTNGRVQYANFSGWDIYRSESQFLAMIAPKHASDMAQSLLRDYQQGGTFPRWGVPNMDSGIMMGDPAAAIIADFYAFGADNFDVKDALDGLVRAATDPSVYAPRSKTYERNALNQYLSLGYVPENQSGGYGNVSMTLEYNTDDFGVSQLADALGDSVKSKLLLNHAQYWRNLYNPATGYIQMRRNDGSWAPGFVTNSQTYDNDQAYVEGNAAQYVWMVPFNIKTLAEMMGGVKDAVKRLDNFLSLFNVGQNSPYAWMGNEPSLETPWIYCFLGQPYKTQSVVRRIMMTLYSSGTNAYPGNDDLGEMSSWYLWSALGMYPELPGSNVLVLGSPFFPEIILHLKGGDVTIIGNGADAPYVRSLTVNGTTWSKPWIKFSDISKGGTLVYTLGSSPDSSWGSNPSDAPPSYPLGTPGTPNLLKPASNDTLGVNDTTLIWQSVPGAKSYELQISQSNAFPSTVVDTTSITDTSFGLQKLIGSKLLQGNSYYWRVEAINDSGFGAYSLPWSFVLSSQNTGVLKLPDEVPKYYSLEQNYPDPFNPATMIKYSIPKPGFVSLKVFNVLGQEVATLVNSFESAGNYQARFNANQYASGTYIYVLRAGNFTGKKKMILLK